MHFSGWATVKQRTSSKTSRGKHDKEHGHACIRNVFLSPNFRFWGNLLPFLWRQGLGRAWHHSGLDLSGEIIIGIKECQQDRHKSFSNEDCKER